MRGIWGKSVNIWLIAVIWWKVLQLGTLVDGVQKQQEGICKED
jgi:hypothetical protein